MIRQTQCLQARWALLHDSAHQDRRGPAEATGQLGACSDQAKNSRANLNDGSQSRMRNLLNVLPTSPRRRESLGF